MNELINHLAAHPEQANASAAVTSAITAIVSLLIAGLSIFLSARSLRIQDKHNQLMVRPVPRITLESWDGSINLNFCNHGFGPLVINSFSVSDGNLSSPDIDTFLPTPPRDLKGFGAPSIVRPGAVIKAGGNFSIIRMELDLGQKGSYDYYVSVFNLIISMKFAVTYTDIYENVYPTHTRVFEVDRNNE